MSSSAAHRSARHPYSEPQHEHRCFETFKPTVGSPATGPDSGRLRPWPGSTGAPFCLPSQTWTAPLRQPAPRAVSSLEVYTTPARMRLWRAPMPVVLGRHPTNPNNSGHSGEGHSFQFWTKTSSIAYSTETSGKSDPCRPRVSDRAALNGILFVMKTRIRWNHLPTRLGFGSGATC